MQRFEYANGGDDDDIPKGDFVSELLDVLVFESKSMMQNTSFSNSLMASVCIHVKGNFINWEVFQGFKTFLITDSFAKCMGLLGLQLQKLKDFERISKKSQAKLRIRRDAICGGGGGSAPRTLPKKIEADLDNNLVKLRKTGQRVLSQTSQKFNLRHVLDDIDFDMPLTLGRKSTLANKRQ